MTGRDRMALGVGGGIVLLALLLFRVGPWTLGAIGAARARLVERQALLQETRSAIRQLPGMEDTARGLTERVAHLAPRLLAGPTGPAALSDLSGRLTTIASLHHARLVSLQPTPDSATAGMLRRLSASLVLETDFRGLAEWLEVLSREQLAIRPEALRISPVDPYAPPRQPELLRVELQLSAWYLTTGVGS